MSELPDVYVEYHEDGFVIVANKRGRKFINAGFEKPRPQWTRIARNPRNILASPEYRALEIEEDGAVAAMLSTAHRSGLSAAFKCAHCEELHVVDDEMADRLEAQAMDGVAGVVIGPQTVQ